MISDFFTSHRQFEAERPDEARYARDIAAVREARGVPAGREFPCKGALRVQGRIGERLELLCDACGFEVTVPAPVESGPVVEPAPF